MYFHSVLNDEAKKNAFRAKAKEYMERAEKLNKHVENEKKSGQFHEQIRIDPDSTGHSYQSLFGRFLDDHVRTVHVDDPYIRSHHQVRKKFFYVQEFISKLSETLGDELSSAVRTFGEILQILG